MPSFNPLLKKLIPVGTLLFSSAILHAAEPVTNAPQCAVDDAEVICGKKIKVWDEKKIGRCVTDLWREHETCLSKAGNKNFIRQGKKLIVLLENGKQEVLLNDKYSVYSYSHYDANTNFHHIDQWFFVNEGDGENRNLEVIDHVGGRYEAPGAYISPNRRWGVSFPAICPDFSCSGSDLSLRKLPPRGEEGKPEDAKVAISGQSESDGDVRSNLENVEWLSKNKAQLAWSCTSDSKITDLTTMTLQNDSSWVIDHFPCKKTTNAKNQTAVTRASKSAVPANTKLRAGMTLDEVETLLGRSADGYKINPLAFLGKKEVTRVWKGSGGQIEVIFVGDIVSSWR